MKQILWPSLVDWIGDKNVTKLKQWETQNKKKTWHIPRKRERIVMCHRKCATFGTTNGMKIEDNIMHDNDNQILFDFWYYTIWCTMFSEWVSVCNIWRGGFLRGTRMNTNNEWSNRFVEVKKKQKELVWQPNHNWCSNLTFNPDIKTFEHSTDFSTPRSILNSKFPFFFSSIFLFWNFNLVSFVKTLNLHKYASAT